MMAGQRKRGERAMIASVPSGAGRIAATLPISGGTS